jgi:hypothetical protein
MKQFDNLQEIKIMKQPLDELLTKAELEELTENELENLSYNQLREMQNNPELLKEQVRKSRTKTSIETLLGDQFLIK